MIQPRMPIGAAASAQIPRIWARLYCSLRLSSRTSLLSPSDPRPFVHLNLPHLLRAHFKTAACDARTDTSTPEIGQYLPKTVRTWLATPPLRQGFETHSKNLFGKGEGWDGFVRSLL